MGPRERRSDEGQVAFEITVFELLHNDHSRGGFGAHGRLCALAGAEATPLSGGQLLT
jgi:hypothetical protein